MNRATLAHVGAVCAVLGGILILMVASQFLFAILSPVSGGTTGDSTGGEPLLMVFMVLSFAGLLAPLAVMIGLLGLYVLLDASLLARGGLAIAAVAALLLFVLPIFPYGLLFDGSDPSPTSDTIDALLLFSSLLGAVQGVLLATGLVLLYVAATRARVLGFWRPLLPAIGLASILASSAVLVLPALGLPGGSIVFEASRFASGLLWIALGAAVWRHAPAAGGPDASGDAAPANL